MIQVGEHLFSAQTIIDELSKYLMPERLLKIQQVALHRIVDVVPVLENIYDRGNISAVMRTGEALGFANMAVIDSKPQKFKAANRVTQGADKWLEVKNYSSALEAIEDLNSQGFAVYATALTEKSLPLDQVPFEKKMAFILGNEKDGVSPEALNLCQGNFLIPMSGFSQSFNISVAAALVFQQAVIARKNNLRIDQDLQNELIAKYMLKSLGSGQKILEQARLNGKI